MYLTPLQLETVKKGTYAERPAESTSGTLYYTTDTQELYLYTTQGWILPATPPAVPTSLVGTDSASGREYNNGRASISFTQPTTAGVALTYTAIATPVGSGAPITATGSSSPVLVTGLAANTSYTYTITGSNSYGQTITLSTPSVLSTTVPQAPTSIVASAGNTTASVSVTNAATGGKAITSYTVTPYVAGVAQTGLVVSNSSLPVSVTGLTNGTAYTFTITANNANGSSAQSVASSSVTPSVAILVDYLIVAGGGGGAGRSSGYNKGSGGGAGGYRYFTSQVVTPSVPYTVTVGSGGPLGSSRNRGTNGTNSSFADNSSTGGGHGMPEIGISSAGSGGSGGGSSSVGPYGSSGGSGNAGGYTPPEGYNGAASDQGGFGGGSSGVAVQAVGGGTAGSAGPGTSNSITGTAVTYATGSYADVLATANSGDGGGGSSSASGRSGASGVVIIRTLNTAASATVSPTIDGSYKVYKFITSGSITF